MKELIDDNRGDGRLRTNRESARKVGPKRGSRPAPALTNNRIRSAIMAKPFPSDISDDVKARFWAKVDARSPDECWPWRSTHTEKGYARISWQRKNYFAHRLAYELTHGPISADMVIDHICRNRGCVNPAHLEPVTIKQNTLRGVGITATYAASDTCPKGHPRVLSNIPENSKQKGQRACRACHNERNRQRRKRISMERLALAAAALKSRGE